MLTRYTKLAPANSPRALIMAAGCVAVATACRLALGGIIGSAAPFITMFPAVLLATVIGGLGPGLLAIALSTVSTWYFFIEPVFSFSSLTRADVVSIALFIFGALLTVLAATSMRRAVERVELAQEKLLAALDASGTGTWRWDIQKDVIEWDPAILHVFGLAPFQEPRKLEELVALIHPDDRERMKQVVREVIRKREKGEYEFRAVTSNGAARWVYGRSRVVCDAEGQPHYMIGACLDITERKKAEERQMLLIHELNHRVKNTLATVQSLAAQTLRSSPSPEIFQANFMARLMALSATHDILTRTFWESAPLRDVLVAEPSPYDGLDRRRIQIQGETVQLKPQQALGLGMTFHELATNAAKYGALSSAQGQVEISWNVEEPLGTGERELVIR